MDGASSGAEIGLMLFGNGGISTVLILRVRTAPVLCGDFVIHSVV